MTTIDLYLDDLNVFYDAVAATFTGDDVAPPTNINGTLYYECPVNLWQGTFGIYMDGDDVSDEDPLLRITNIRLPTQPTSGLVAALTTVDGVTDAYTRETKTLEQVAVELQKEVDADPLNLPAWGVVYTSRKINDFSRLNADTSDPDCNLDFLSELSRSVFGSPDTIDLFHNEDDVAVGFANSINAGAEEISGYFTDADGSVDGVDALSSQDAQLDGNKGLVVCNKIFKYMKKVVPERFTLKGGAVRDGNGISSTGAPPNSRQPAGGVDANIFLEMENPDVNGVQEIIGVTVNTPGSGYSKGDVLVWGVGDDTVTLTLNSIHAGMLNGRLGVGANAAHLLDGHTFTPANGEAGGEFEDLDVSSSGAGTGAKLDIYWSADGLSVQRIAVNTIGAGYVADDTVTVTDLTAPNAVTHTIILTADTAAMLNGQQLEAIELPIIEGDIFNSVITINSNTNQKMVDQTDSVTFARRYLLKMRMGAPE